MITRTAAILITLTFISQQALAQNRAAYQVLENSLDKEIPVRLKSKKVPGMAIVVFDHGKVVYKKGIGLADVKNKESVTTRTGFNIGSISKMVTAWGVVKLATQNKIDLDAPIEKYVTRWKLPPSEFDVNKVTVRALLSHTAGISVHGYPGFRPEQTLPTLERSLDGVNGDVREDEKVEIILEPQTRFKYSGGGYTLLQLMIEEVTGRSFAEYMESEVFKPLGMHNTSFIIDQKILKHSAKPYNEEGEEIYLERFTAQAAAGLHTTLEDMITFAKATFNGNKVLDKQTLSLMQQPVEASGGRYGLGYESYRFGPVTVQGHAGSNDGWESGFMMDFASNSGVIMLTNGSNGKDVAIATLRQWMQWRMKSAQND